MSNIILFSTCPKIPIAIEISKILVREKLIACANIIPGIQSIYRWKGEIEHENEILLVMKSQKELFLKISARIKELHPYDTPEITATEIILSDHEYASWIINSTKDSKG